MIGRLLFDTDNNRFYVEEPIKIGEEFCGKNFVDVTEQIVELIKNKL